MSYYCDDVDTALSGYHTSVYTGLGLPGADVPSSGSNGASVLYPCITLPADAAVEVFAQITRLPTFGTLVFSEDGSFDYSGATDYLEFRLWVDGVASTTNIGYGPGIARVTLTVGAVINFDPTAQLLVVAGHAPTIAQPITVTPGAQQIIVTGGVPLISQSQSLSPDCQQITIAGWTPTISQSVTLAAQIWGHMLSNGLTAEQVVVEILAKLNELHMLEGLKAGTPLVVSDNDSTRVAGSITQTVVTTGGVTTVTRV